MLFILYGRHCCLFSIFIFVSQQMAGILCGSRIWFGWASRSNCCRCAFLQTLLFQMMFFRSIRFLPVILTPYLALILSYCSLLVPKQLESWHSWRPTWIWLVYWVNRILVLKFQYWVLCCVSAQLVALWLSSLCMKCCLLRLTIVARSEPSKQYFWAWHACLQGLLILRIE